MRKSSPLDALISRTTQAVLAATLADPGRWWYLSDLARHLGRSPSSLQRPLAALVAAGILCRRAEGNRVYVRADRQCPLLAELRGLLDKTIGMFEVLGEALGPARDRILVAFVHGSTVAGAERAASDVDLVVVGEAGLAELSAALENAERRLQRPVNVSLYAPREFQAKFREGNHFLRSVLEGKKQFLIGGTDELEALVGRRPRRRASHEQSRNSGLAQRGRAEPARRRLERAVRR